MVRVERAQSLYTPGGVGVERVGGGGGGGEEDHPTKQHKVCNCFDAWLGAPFCSSQRRSYRHDFALMWPDAGTYYRVFFFFCSYFEVIYYTIIMYLIISTAWAVPVMNAQPSRIYTLVRGTHFLEARGTRKPTSCRGEDGRPLPPRRPSFRATLLGLQSLSSYKNDSLTPSRTHTHAHFVWCLFNARLVDHSP